MLHVVFTATYPKSIPLLSLKLDDGLREGTRFKLQKVVETKSKEMAVERPMDPMIHEIGEALKEILDEAAEAKAAGRELPSLEEERAMHEADAVRKAAREHEELAAIEKQAQIAEEERLAADAQVLVAKYEQISKDSRRKSRAHATYGEQIIEEDFEETRERVVFDEPVKLIDDFGNERTFQAVTGYYRIRQGPVSECFTARPVLKGDPAQLLVLKKTTIRSSENKKSEFRNQLAGLEKELSNLMKIDRENILRIYAYKMTKESKSPDSLWTVSILTEYGNKGSLEECLEISGGLTTEKVKAWAMVLINALNYLHSQGIVHRDLHASNVLLVRSPLGIMTPKIADAGFQHRLHALKNAQSIEKLGLARSVYWVPPENVNAERPQFTDKTDIWDFGIIFLQMIWGLGVLSEFSAPQRIPEEQALSRSLDEMIRKVFAPDPKKRTRAHDLKMSTFLVGNDERYEETSMPLSKSGSTTALTSSAFSRGRHGSMIDHRPLHFSRYQEDFVQEARLGKGGFGEVLKARKKLDGQFYAVKRITQKSTSSLEEIIKEVQFLSALRHPYIVQYHNSWTEIISDSADADGSTDLDVSTVEGTTEALSPENGLRIEFGTSTGGLDFISSSRYIEFEDDEDADTCSDDDEEAVEDDDEFSTPSNRAIPNKYKRQLALTRTRSDSRQPGITVLYIQ